MSDSYGDGWNGNILGIKQNKTIVSTFSLFSGSTAVPLSIIVQGNLPTQVFINQLGNKTN